MEERRRSKRARRGNLELEMGDLPPATASGDRAGTIRSERTFRHLTTVATATTFSQHNDGIGPTCASGPGVFVIPGGGQQNRIPLQRGAATHVTMLAHASKGLVRPTFARYQSHGTQRGDTRMLGFPVVQ